MIGKMTHAQAVATALLNARRAWRQPSWWPHLFHLDEDALAYAWRRLRARAGVGV